MAYTFKTNIKAGQPLARPPLDQSTTHKWFIAHCFSSELGTTATSVNKLIEANSSLDLGVSSDKKRLPERTHLEITNTHATAKIAVAYYDQVTTSIYSWLLQPNGGFLKEPVSYDADLFIISDTGSTSLLINEVG